MLKAREARRKVADKVFIKEKSQIVRGTHRSVKRSGKQASSFLQRPIEKKRRKKNAINVAMAIGSTVTLDASGTRGLKKA